MRTKTSFAILAALCFSLSVPVWAGDGARKLPNPKRSLTKSFKAFRKAKGYKIALDVQGGISKTKDHKISNQTVRESYEGDYYRGLMHMPKERVFRKPNGGAVRGGNGWTRLLATKRGARIDRLFRFPSEILAEAARFGKTFEWLDIEEQTELVGEGHTGVVVKKSAESNKLRVEVPAKIAEERFITVQNSGCMSGG